jgi:hypothetical protein
VVVRRCQPSSSSSGGGGGGGGSSSSSASHMAARVQAALAVTKSGLLGVLDAELATSIKLIERAYASNTQLVDIAKQCVRGMVRTSMKSCLNCRNRWASRLYNSMACCHGLCTHRLLSLCTVCLSWQMFPLARTACT